MSSSLMAAQRTTLTPLQLGVASLSLMGCAFAFLLWGQGRSTVLMQQPTLPATAMKVAPYVQSGVPFRAPTSMQVHAQNVQVMPDAGNVAHVHNMPLSMENEASASNNVSVLVMAAISLVAGFVFGRFSKRGSASQEQLAMVAVHGRKPLQLYAASQDELAEQAEMLSMEAEEKIDGALEASVGKFGTVRTGRATPALLDRVRVDYYGALTPLKQIAGISVPEATTLVISPFDKTALGAIEKAIGGDPDLGMTCNSDGDKIRINIPPLTAERRKEMAKLVSKMGEEGKVQIRNIRRDTLKAADKLKLAEDAAADFKDDIQKLTDAGVKKIDKMVEAKEKELTSM